ncbi:MAG: stage II sporulation protein M [Anaerolineales bacterium]
MASIQGHASRLAQGALIITRREIRDQLRDWRILAPIIILTLFFPLLMNFTAQRAVGFVQEYGADIIAERLIPFLLMIVGFFPISVSLVIALESFAGERERNSLEPLLTTPLDDTQLYLGKILASLFVPLGAAYLGILFYLVGLAITVEWYAPPQLLAQVILLTGAQGLVMVSGAVVVSSQTTSVRAANLLASFIIIPVSQLIIGESMIMFWGRYHVLWWIVLALVVIALVLVRMGLHLFNREQLLGREIDVLNFGWAWRTFKDAFLRGAKGPRDWLKGVLLGSLPRLKASLLIMAAAFLAAYLIGVDLADKFQLPPDLMAFGQFDSGSLDQFREFGFLSGRGLYLITVNNLRAIGLATFLGIFSFGVMAVVLLMAPITIVGYFAGNAALAGLEVPRFLLALVVPHGVLEVPAALIAGAAILELGMALIRPSDEGTLGGRWLKALAEWARVSLVVVAPLLLAAAALEVFVTPRVALALLGSG